MFTEAQSLGWLNPASGSKSDREKFNDAHPIASNDAPPIASNDASNFSLTKFSLKGQAEKMKKDMLAEVHVMKNIALLGQITAIYAPPNTGKTMLVIHLIKEAIKHGVIRGENIFYINADDSYNGLIEKVILAEKYGFHMLAPENNGFKTKELTQHMKTMIEQDSAKEKVIILDTLKKFTDLMDKKNCSDFMNTARAFSTKGGTLILLAHTNKNRNAEGKVVAGGTSDIGDDADCVFLLDETSHNNDIKSVFFENTKARGNVGKEIGFTYSTSANHNYEQKLDSVTALDAATVHTQKEALTIAVEQEQNQPIIDVITVELSKCDQLKTNLIDLIHKSGFSVRSIRAVLTKYEGEKWNVIPNGRNSKKYSIK